jgi:diacylglycerol kinase (ATP)
VAARQIVLLTNPTSGRGHGMRIAAVALSRMRSAGLVVRSVVGRSAEESGELARSAVAAGADSLVVAGGDGLVHVAVQALAGSTTRLGIIPAGTGNDVARSLDIPRSDPRRAADVVVGTATRRVDLGRCGDRYFASVLATGVDAAVSERAAAMRHPRGALRYPVATLAELCRFRPSRYVLRLDGARRDVEAMLVAVGNGPSYGRGLRIAQGASLDDGRLDVVVIRAMTRRDLVRTLPRLYRGTHTRHPAYEHHRVHTVQLASPGAVAYADGERIGALPVDVAVAPGALEVLVPDE